MRVENFHPRVFLLAMLSAQSVLDALMVERCKYTTDLIKTCQSVK